MKVLLQVSPRASIEVEGDNHTDVFEGLAGGQEVFGHDKCGVCNGESLRFIVRSNDDEDKFYEMLCLDVKCRAKLAFGCMKKPKGALYPKRKWDSLSPSEKVSRGEQEDYSTKHFGYLPYNGWYKYVKKD
jgi:hypothetical protein